MAQSKFLSLTGLDTYDAKIKDWVEKKGYTTPDGHNHDGRYYTESEVNNLLNNYLKLAGGTITGTLTINRDASAIHYNNSSGTSWGWMGFKAKDTPAVWENTGTTSYNILHAGNSGVSLSGSTLTVKINGTEHSLTNTNTTYGAATQSMAGLMSAADKKKLDGIASGANAYSLPLSASNTRGGIKIGYTESGANIPLQLSSEKGYVTLTKNSVISALGYTPPTTNTTYGAATQSAAGLMSADDKKKLDGIATGANNYTYTHPTSDAAGTKGATANVTGTEGKTIKVPKITVDSLGHVTGLSEYTYTSKNTTYDAATQSAAGLMSAADKKKLDGIATGANAYTHPSTHPASIITGLATVATSGSYNDLSNKPTIPTSLPANGGSSTYAARLGDANGYYTKASLDTALSGKAATHDHPYLSLDGGTLNSNKSITLQGTCGISHKGTKGTYQMIGFLDNTANNYGNGIRIGGGGTTIIGAGESSTGLLDNSIITDYNDEILHLASDGAINFYSNCDTIANRKSMVFKDGVLSIGGTAVSLSTHNHDSAYAAKSHSHDNYLTGITKTMVTNALGYTPPTTNTTYTFTDANPNLSWGTKSKVATIGGTDIHVTMPANPNTDTKYTAGTNISISSSNVISATDTTYSNATTSKAGLMSATDKKKLDGIDLSGGITKPDGTAGSLQEALNALKTLISDHSSDANKHKDTVYTHPTTAGNKHIPSGGSSGQFLAWSSAGTAKWVDNPNTDTIYTHPTTAGNKHIPSGGSSGQFLAWSSAGTAKWVDNPNTDTNTWRTVQCNGTSIGSNILNIKAGTNVTVSNSNGTITISSTDTNTVYTHPTTSGSKHIPSGGSSGQFLGWSSDGTAKWVNNPNTNTDTKVTNNTTTSQYYLCGSTSSSNTTGTLVKRSTVYVNTSSAVYASGGFYELSDERLKNFGEPIEVDLEKIKKLPKKYFTWKKDKDNKLNIGTSAQELQKLYPEIVSEGNDGYLNVNYEKLSIVALAAIDKLQDKYDKKIQELEDKLNKVLELIK